MHSTLVREKQQDLLDLLEYGGVLHDTHADQLLRSPVLVENIVGVLPELLHVRPDEHLAELNEVAVLLIVHLDDTPRVFATANFTAIWCLNKVVRAYYGERNFAGNLLRFSQRLLIFILVGWRLEDVDVVVSDVSENLSLM